MANFIQGALAFFDKTFARRFLGFVLFLAAAAGVTELIRGAEALLATDRAVLEWVLSFRTEPLTVLMHVATFLGEAWVVWVLTLFTLFFLWRGRLPVLFAGLGFSVAGASALILALKQLFERPRPDVLALVEEKGFSFPSGHGVLALAFWGALLYFSIQRASSQRAKRMLLFGGSALIVLIGLSRIYLGVHWPSDVAASYLIGVAWLVLVVSQIKRKMGKM